MHRGRRRRRRRRRQNVAVLHDRGYVISRAPTSFLEHRVLNLQPAFPARFQPSDKPPSLVCFSIFRGYVSFLSLSLSLSLVFSRESITRCLEVISCASLETIRERERDVARSITQSVCFISLGNIDLSRTLEYKY